MVFKAIVNFFVVFNVSDSEIKFVLEDKNETSIMYVCLEGEPTGFRSGHIDLLQILHLLD